MAKTVVINIRTDIKTKKEIEDLYSAFGISVSDAVNIFFRQSLMHNGLTFAMQITRYNAETLAAIEEVEKMKRNPELYKSFDSVEALFEDLNNDDEV
ncbi:MAG: type II toxin-antitoxin system RelB/DinJ family antitoxin [Oscillospiraceae bacterium]|nr:type II toxin-antitoxin system RelB/DinJ family antitoxin [Oscillospiraceae bacterium]